MYKELFFLFTMLPKCGSYMRKKKKYFMLMDKNFYWKKKSIYDYGLSISSTSRRIMYCVTNTKKNSCRLIYERQQYIFYVKMAFRVTESQSQRALSGYHIFKEYSNPGCESTQFRRIAKWLNMNSNCEINTKKYLCSSKGKRSPIH